MNYNFASKTDRESTVAELYSKAKAARSFVEPKWNLFTNYYNNVHSKIRELVSRVDDASIAADLCLTDPFIQIESQIDTNVPEPMFIGRDGKRDGDKAKQRQYVVKSILYKNDFKSKNSTNERTMRIYGDSFVKAYFDISADFDGNNCKGDIKVDVINIEDIFPDAAATSIEECEYIIYSYAMHKRRAMRVFKDELKKEGIDLTDGGGIMDKPSLTDKLNSEDQVEIVECWYRDDEGDIACSIIIRNQEIRHIPKYWKLTGSQNKNFPFVHFYRIGNVGSFWNKSELEPIIPLVDAADKILSTALLNMDYNANDVMLIEEGAMPEGEEFDARPGAVNTVKQNKLNNIRRLGGTNKLGEFINDLAYIQNEIQKTCRNYDTNQGAETRTQNTASGLAMLRADAAEQASIKDEDRTNGFKRLFKLIDWLALEYYDNTRNIYIGTPESEEGLSQIDETTMENMDEKRGPIFFKFNSNYMREGEVGADGSYEGYYPAIDCEVNSTSGIHKSKAFTIQALQALLSTQISTANYFIVDEIIKELELPQGDKLRQQLKQLYAPQTTGNEELDSYIQQLAPEQQAAIRNNPKVLQQIVQQFNSQSNGTMPYGASSIG